jgi:hypothetical protein
MMSRCTIARSPITLPQRRATDTPIAARPGPVIFAIAIATLLRHYPEQSGYQDYVLLLSNGFSGKMLRSGIMRAMTALDCHPQGGN